MSRVNDGKEQILFLKNHITLRTKDFSDNIICEHPSCATSLHENYLPPRKLIKHSHRLENDTSSGARSEHQTCFLRATCTSELWRSAINHTYIRIVHCCVLRAGLDLCSAPPSAPEQAINPSSHLAFSDEQIKSETFSAPQQSYCWLVEFWIPINTKITMRRCP